MNELTKPSLVKPLDPSRLSNDAAVLNNLCGELNNPLITGAEVPEGVETTIQTSPVPPAPVMEAPPTVRPAHIEVSRFLFTGLPKSGKSFIAEKMGATVLELDDPIYVLAKIAFSADCSEFLTGSPFVAEIRAWGGRVINAGYPLTCVRAMFLAKVQTLGKSGLEVFGVDPKLFGTEGFWAKSLIKRAERQPGKVAVTDVVSPVDYKLLVQAGFRPYHVMASPVTRSARGGDKVPATSLAESIENDVIKKTSRQPKGAGLWAIWNDTLASPSNRLMTLETFLSLVS